MILPHLPEVVGSVEERRRSCRDHQQKMGAAKETKANKAKNVHNESGEKISKELKKEVF